MLALLGLSSSKLPEPPAFASSLDSTMPSIISIEDDSSSSSRCLFRDPALELPSSDEDGLMVPPPPEPFLLLDLPLPPSQRCLEPPRDLLLRVAAACVVAALLEAQLAPPPVVDELATDASPAMAALVPFEALEPVQAIPGGCCCA